MLDLRHRGRAAGAVVFARGEGAWWGDDAGYFAMTNGGQNTLGQIVKYQPSRYEGTWRESVEPGTIELFAEPNDSALLSNCDNLTVAPWGDLVVSEDTKGVCRIIGITPAGEYYVIAENPHVGNELAGVCFSPDGSTLFANVRSQATRSRSPDRGLPFSRPAQLGVDRRRAGTSCRAGAKAVPI